MMLSQLHFIPVASTSVSPVIRLNSFHNNPVRKKSRRYMENKVIPLINEFYDNFYSYRNLSWKDAILIILFFIFMAGAVFATFKFHNSSSQLNNILLFMCYMPVIILHPMILNRHEKNIAERYNRCYQTNFYSITEAQEDWLERKFGENYQPSEVIKKFEEWRKWREAYPSAYKFQWIKYIYNSDAKARIMGGATALLALVGVLLFNLYKFNDPEPVIEQLIINFYSIFLLSLFVIIPAFLMLLFSRDLLKNLFYSIFDLIYKNEFSESKYKKLLAFLVNRLEINNN